MALVRGYATVVVDNPDADGLITANKHGYGYTWRFRQADENPSDPNRSWEPTWNYTPFNLVNNDFYLLAGCEARPIFAHTYSNVGEWDTWTAITVGDYWGDYSVMPVAGYVYHEGDTLAVQHTVWYVGSFNSGVEGQYFLAVNETGQTVALTEPPDANLYIAIARVVIEGGKFVEMEDLRYEPTGLYVVGPTTYVDYLQACMPAGYMNWKNMSWTNWTREPGFNSGLPTSGNWRLADAAHYPQRKFAHYDCARPEAWGAITSVEYFRGEVALVLYQYAPPWGQLNPPRTRIELIQAGAGETYWVNLPLSGAKNAIKNPTIGKKNPEGDKPEEELKSADWMKEEVKNQIARLEPRAVTIGCQPLKTVAGMELGPIVVHDSYANKPWVYCPGEGIGMIPYRLRITAYGHALAVAACQVKYPLTSYAEPYEYLVTPGWVEAAHHYYALGYAPSGTSVTAVSAVDGTAIGTTNSDRPRLVFTSDGLARPLCYGVAQIHSSTIGSARSSPVTVTGGVLLSARGGCDDTWRNSTCDFTMRVGTEQYVWKGNEKVAVTAGWSSVAAGVKSDSGSLQFTGYLTGSTRRKDPNDLAKVYVEAHCEDGIAARLSGKKAMLYHACYASLDADDVFAEIMTRAGVPTSMLDGTALAGLTLPISGRGGDLMWQFANDYEVVSALDDIAKALGMVFGVNEQGTYWMAPRAVYSGTPDYTLDDDNLTDTDAITAISAERANPEFRNYVATIVRGNTGQITDEVVLYDAASHRTTSAVDFIGDDWWEVNIESEAISAYDLGLKRWREVFRRRQVLQWTTAGKPTLWPGDYVKVQTSKLDVATDTVFRIVTKEWEIEQDSGKYTCSFGAIKEADPA